MKIDFSKLSCEELTQLEKELQEHKSSRKNLRVYKVTFYVGFTAKNHENDELRAPDVFGDYFVNYPAYMIDDYFHLCGSEQVSRCDVVELNYDEFPERFKS